MDEVEACDMHDGDKIGRSGIGELIWSKNKVPVNPFTNGHNLMMKFQSMSKHFSSSQCYRLNYAVILENNTDIPKKVIQRDLNKTRINSLCTNSYKAP